MITRLVAVAMLIAQGAGAQALTGPMPQQPYKGEARAGVTFGGVNRTSVRPGSTADASVNLTGVEVFARAANIGIYARALSGTQEATGHDLAGNFSLTEARIMIGAANFSVEGGVVSRSAATVGIDSSVTLLRVGARSQWDLGASGLQVTLNGGPRWVKLDDQGKAKLAFTGFDAEATLLYQLPRNLPIYAAVGWRYERFEDVMSGSGRAEEGSGPFFGLGVRFAQRPVIR